MQLCSMVPSAAYLLSTCGGILATNATLPGQLMTRLAVLPPTTLLCCMFGPQDGVDSVTQRHGLFPGEWR